MRMLTSGKLSIQIALLTVVLGSLLLASASSTHALTHDKSSTGQQTIINLGLIPEQDLFSQKKRYQPLMDHLGKELGVQIQLRVLPRYGNLLDNFDQLGLDAAFFGSFTGALAIKKLAMIPLVRPQFIGGRSTYYGMVFVRKESQIRTADDLRGKRMVFVDRATTAGYLLPLAFFKQLGVTNYADWFGSYYFSGTHEDAILEVLNGHADIGAAKNTIFYQLAEKNRLITQNLEILATSPQVPANALLVRKDLPEELRLKLQEKLLTLQQSSSGQEILKNFGAEKFILTHSDDYQPVLDYADLISLDLTTYRYNND
jgi:phosphonate transport system substrate-binding protein